MERIKKYQRILQEMAFKRSEIEQEIRSSDRNRREHLVLCYYLPKHTANNHWQQEIYADIKDIADRKWKNNNWYLSEKEYLDNLWNKPYENKDEYEIIDKTIEGLIYDKYKIPKDWKDEKDDLVISLHNLYQEISKLLSEGKISRLVVYKLIEKYIIK